MVTHVRIAGTVAVTLVLQVPGLYAQPRGIFLFDNVQQRTEVEYLYSGSALKTEKGRDSASSRETLREAYVFDIDYAILHPNLLVGHVGLGTGLDQQNGSFAGWDLRHNIDGTLYRYKPLNGSFFSKTERTRVSGELSDPHSVEQQSYGASVAFGRRSLPITLDLAYRGATTQTRGLPQDYRRADESLTLSAQQRAAFTESNLTARHAETHLEDAGAGGTSKVRSHLVTFSNHLRWSSRGRLRSLGSTLDYRRDEGAQSSGGDIDSESLRWAESLTWHFGKALESGLQLSRSSNRTAIDSTRTNDGRFHLQHRLLNSLRSRVELARGETELPSGMEQTHSWTGELSYEKRLRAESRLGLQTYYRSAVVDRHVDEPTLAILDEPHSPGLLDQFTLQRPRVVEGSVVVRHANAATRPLPYQSPRDFLVERLGATTVISIPPGSQVVADARPDGTTPLLVSYRFEADPDVKTRETVRQVSGSLGLFGSAHRLYASWSEAEEELLSGGSGFSNAGSRRTLITGVRSQGDGSTYNLEYSFFQAPFEERQVLKANASWWRRYRAAQAMLAVSDSYSVVEAATGVGENSTAEARQNTFGVQLSYRRPVFAADSVHASTSYYKTTGDVMTRDDVRLGLDYEILYGKFSLALQSKIIWRLTGDQQQRQDWLWLKVARYF